MRSRKLVVAVTFLVLGIAGAATLSAQTSTNPILVAIAQVQETLDDLVDTVNSLVPAESNVLFTPSLHAIPGVAVGCHATNVSDATRTIAVQLFETNTGALVAQTSDQLPPHRNLTTATTGLITAFCKITVVNGVKSDVRGAIALFAFDESEASPLAAH